TEDIEGLRYNTAISALMVLLNEFEAMPDRVGADDLKVFLKLLAPFAPHITEELNHQLLGNSKFEIRNSKQARNHKSQKTKKQFNSIHLEPWPRHSPRLIKEELVDFVVQVNGKTRGVIKLSIDSSQEDAEVGAKINKEIAKHLIGPVRRVVFVKDKLINFVME
ncbi:MAG: class I tRNA ligase family protein, partial [Patescibacteria group bacterium]